MIAVVWIIDCLLERKACARVVISHSNIIDENDSEKRLIYIDAINNYLFVNSHLHSANFFPCTTSFCFGVKLQFCIITGALLVYFHLFVFFSVSRHKKLCIQEGTGSRSSLSAAMAPCSVAQTRVGYNIILTSFSWELRYIGRALFESKVGQ
jgi:hypothetical protein